MYVDLHVFVAILFSKWVCFVKSSNSDLYSNEWVVHIKGGENVAKRVAEIDDQFIFHGQLGSLTDYYLLEHNDVPKRTRRSADSQHLMLETHPDVIWLEQQKILSRKKRGFFSDPLFDDQWYLDNHGQTLARCSSKLDINILPVWNKNITGSGVVVSILDDGLEHSHPDLERNYDAQASHDYNSKDADPFPRYSADNINKHGTRCAGEVAAEINNNICGVGVSFNAKVGGIRMLDGDVTDAVEAASLSLKPQYIDIYSSSWGPDDDGKTVDGPGPMAKKAFNEGIAKGRKGLGSIFVWATGNGGRAKDYCACDGYINSIYTVSIGAVDDCGKSPWYAEPCPGTLAVTYSSGEVGRDLQIATTDLHHRCTKDHTGTSAAAPLAAGIIALVLEANPRLTWRDLQHLIVRTSKVVSPDDSEWQTNAAEHKVNNKFGFGALDAGSLISLAMAETWSTATQQITYDTLADEESAEIPERGSVVKTITTDGCEPTTTSTSERASVKKCITRIEHLQVFVTLDHNRRGLLVITLLSPSGVESNLLQRRPRDTSRDGFKDWPFLTVFNWDEKPTGVWKLTVTDHSGQRGGHVTSWRLRFFGTAPSSSERNATRHVDEADVCRRKCRLGCRGSAFADECLGCSSFCDCTTGECVSACPADLVMDAALRHCLSSEKSVDYRNIPNSGANNAAGGLGASSPLKKNRPLIGISLSAKFAIICLSLVVLCALVAGIAYMAHRMPRTNIDYRSVPRYPCEDRSDEPELVAAAMHTHTSPASAGQQITSSLHEDEHHVDIVKS